MTTISFKDGTAAVVSPDELQHIKTGPAPFMTAAKTIASTKSSRKRWPMIFDINT